MKISDYACRRRSSSSLQRAGGGRRGQPAGGGDGRGQAPNDKQQIEPMVEKIGALPAALGEAENLLADTGYFSEDNVEACEKAGIEPAIAMGRQPHHPPLAERFAKAPAAPDNPTPVEAMAHRLRTPEGRALYALRKQTPEPVFGIIKSVLGFRQFSLRGLDKVRGEWSLVTMAWNIKRMFASPPPIEGGAPPAQRMSSSIAGPTGSIGAPTEPDWASTTATKRKNPFKEQLRKTQSDRLLRKRSPCCRNRDRAMHQTCGAALPLEIADGR